MLGPEYVCLEPPDVGTTLAMKSAVASEYTTLGSIAFTTLPFKNTFCEPLADVSIRSSVATTSTSVPAANGLR